MLDDLSTRARRRGADRRGLRPGHAARGGEGGAREGTDPCPASPPARRSANPWRTRRSRSTGRTTWAARWPCWTRCGTRAPSGSSPSYSSSPPPPPLLRRMRRAGEGPGPRDGPDAADQPIGRVEGRRRHRARRYARLQDLGAVSLRYFNVAGAFRTADGTWIGERHDLKSHLIPNILAIASALHAGSDGGRARDTRPSRSSAPTTPSSTGLPSGTTSTSATSRTRTCSPWPPARTGCTGSITSATVQASRCGRS